MEITVTDGICTGRNGTVDIAAVNIMDFGNTIQFDGISKKRRIMLNAGFSMDREAAKNLAKGILSFIASMPNARPHAEEAVADSVQADVRRVFPKLGPWCKGCLQQGDGVCMIAQCVRYPPNARSHFPSGSEVK